jgi:hypothetical protein
MGVVGFTFFVLVGVAVTLTGAAGAVEVGLPLALPVGWGAPEDVVGAPAGSLAAAPLSLFCDVHALRTSAAEASRTPANNGARRRASAWCEKSLDNKWYRPSSAVAVVDISTSARIIVPHRPALSMQARVTKALQLIRRA